MLYVQYNHLIYCRDDNNKDIVDLVYSFSQFWFHELVRIRGLDLEVIPPGTAFVSLLSFRTQMGCCSISAYKRQVSGKWEGLEEELTGKSMKIYVGIDMAKDKFVYCEMDDALNILWSGSNKENSNERFMELSDLIITLKLTSAMMKIDMESTGIYHIPLYNHMRTDRFPALTLNEPWGERHDKFKGNEDNERYHRCGINS